MHIENVHINLGGGPLAAAVLAGLLAEAPKQEARPTPNGAIPKIGDAWPGIDGVYAGLSRGENGEADGHLVLLNAKPDGFMNFADSTKWAKGIGGGARLPTRFEAALLYANLQDQFDKDRAYWTGEQYSDAYAWSQGFDDGNQYWTHKSTKLPARAVRRLSPSVL
jgi:hypothetical protein